ncbi:hypothetical protein DUT91_24370 [Phyllobacterium salinisoli]|uniref:DUF1570 domain-containing protein n=2 Tax=Phyllobacterium salinisoli TaxID=1899321 RepID=A0A368JZ13_9HYPH|nr:hypothetical protein DUT91_24370 [Phyllobacterium salinisoli]
MMQPALADTTYIVEPLAARDNTLRVSVRRPVDAGATTLVLRGTGFGIAPQVEAASCDGALLAHTGQGQWTVPAGCQLLAWMVPLDPPGQTPASAQRSLAMPNGIFLSEASSLPRLKDAGPIELLRLPAGPTFPVARNGVLHLPKPTEAPLFVLLGAQPLDRRRVGNTGLDYFIDNPAARDRLPDIGTHLEGLRWLRSQDRSDAPLTFTILWLGVPRELFAVGGATGRGLLIVNYRAGTVDPTPIEKAMRLYVPLHEAVHQLGEKGVRPLWMEESLASYFGMRAARAATGDAPETKALFEQFRNNAGKFSDGLLAISRRVEEGNQAEYAAFFTKGLAFWDAVNVVLQQRGDQLDPYLRDLLDAKFESEVNVPERLRSILRLPKETWEPLRKQYLG